MPRTTNLIQRIATYDDKLAFESLLKLYSERLFTYAMVLLKKEELAEEVVSDVWLKLWNNRKRLTEIIHFDSYLYTAIKNQALSYSVKENSLNGSLHRIRDYHHLPIEPASLEPDPFKQLEAKELKEVIIEVTNLLPPLGKKAFRMVREEGRSYQESADALGISVNTLKTHLRRATKKLRKQISIRFSEFTLL
ncbi:MAG: sigma-70 family RNA polymerase sigma factor [Bacteroidia bacterium]|nr:sigma-70 family RNA polymerase sigma factor [Bacteroidia bacterium]